MASSTIVTDLTIHTAHIRLRSGKYMLVYYTNEYDEDGNPINITIYDSSETLIENPPYEIVYEVTKTIPPPEGDWLNNLWFKNGVNSLSPRQSPGQTNNIFLGFETAENFGLTDLVTYSGDHNFIAGYQLALSLTTGSYNTIFGRNNFNGITNDNYNLLFGFGNINNANSSSFTFSSGLSNNSIGASSVLYGFFNGRENANNATTITAGLLNGAYNAENSSSVLYSFLNGLQNAENSSSVLFSSLNGQYNAQDVTGSIDYSFLNGQYNFRYGGSIMDYNFGNGLYNFALSVGDKGYNNANGAYNHYNSSGYYNFSNGFSNFRTATASQLMNFTNGWNNFYSAISGNYNFANGDNNGYSVSSASTSFLAGYRNIYTSTSSLSNTIAIGYQNGYNNVNHSNSIYLGYRQGFTTGAANRLMIGMASDDPLISGHFTNDWIRINGYLEVRDKTGITTGNVVVWDGDKLVDSGSAIGSLGGDPDQTLTWTNTSTTVRNLTISGTGNTVELDGLAVEMALDDIVLNTSWRYQALDVNGVVLGAPLIIQEGTDINIVRSGNTLIFNSTAGGGDPDQMLSYSPTTALLTISGSGNTVQLDDLVHDSVWSGTSGTISYTMIDVDNLQVGDPLIFNAGTGITITRSTNTLTFSASGASLWTDAGTYYRPNNLSNLASNSFRIYDTGRVTIGGTSDPTPYLLSVNGIGRFTSGVSLNGNLEFTNSSNIVFDSGGSGNIVDTNGVSGSSGKFLGHDGGGVAWVDAPGYTPTYATSTGNADTFTTGTYVNINGASTTYTIPVTEVLAVWCSVIILGGSSGANVTVSIRKNSSIILISRTIFVEAGVEKNISLHSNDDFNSGDTLRIHCSTSGSGFETVSTNTTWITVT